MPDTTINAIIVMQDSDTVVNLTVDRVNHRSQEGEENLENLVSCCVPCIIAGLNNLEQLKKWINGKQ